MGLGVNVGAAVGVKVEVGVVVKVGVDVEVDVGVSVESMYMSEYWLGWLWKSTYPLELKLLLGSM